MPYDVTDDRNAPSRSRARSKLAHLRWIVSVLAIPLAAGGLAYHFLSEPSTPLTTDLAHLTKAATPELPVPTELPHSDSPLSKTVEFVVRRNDTMERIFRQLQLDLSDLAAIRSIPEIRKTLDLLKPGDPITFTHGTDGSLQSVSKQMDLRSKLVVTRDAQGFHSELVSTPVTTKQVTTRGHVTSSLYASARQAGLSAEVIMRLANDIFGWDIDFALDIQPNDSFVLTYEQLYRDGQYLGDGDILAAEFVNNGKTYRAVRFQSADGQISNYFTPEGRSMHKQFLRAPVDFTRISSGFSLARFHPVLNRVRAHKGVDYAAPTGTPIKAAGDGKVTFTGKQNGYGNVIILDHGNGITTLYGHMSRFAGARTGNRVKQGELIGYVGMTGLASGPHLHYEYRINGVFKDPRTVPLPKAEPIPAAYMAEFQSQAQPRLAALTPTTTTLANR